MIESKQNDQMKHIKKLSQKKYRDEHNEFVVFGEHLIEEAEKHGNVKIIYTTNNAKKGILITKDLMNTLSQTKTAYERLAIVEKVNKNINSNKVLILEDIQDPSNVGALLRSASGFGFKKVILSEKCADIYNDKAIRASQGAIFHLDIKRYENIYDEIKALKDAGYMMLAADTEGNATQNYGNLVALILGNEGSGISDEAKLLADSTVSIKTETIESLNVAIAGSILMYEWSYR